MFESIIDSSGFTLFSALICSASSVILGAVIAFIYRYTGKTTKSFTVTLILLPVIVQAVIMLVNGNIGTGVAVAGAFSLIRFRSVPGSAREIIAVFYAMAAGLAVGSGYILYAFLFTAIVGIVFIVASSIPSNTNNDIKELKIAIPENLDYVTVFDDLFNKYTSSCELIKSKTTNMGSLYELKYEVELINPKEEKHFIDELRVRNGNLSVSFSHPSVKDEL